MDSEAMMSVGNLLILELGDLKKMDQPWEQGRRGSEEEKKAVGGDNLGHRSPLLSLLLLHSSLVDSRT